MIDVPSLIDIIHDGLKVLVNNDKTYIKYEIKESEESRSLYIYKTLPNEGKLNILRISDHLPTMQDLIRGDSTPRPSPDNNTNVSIDFYVPKKVEYTDKVTGKKKSKIARNRFNNHIGVPSTIPTVEPFTITSYEYFYKNLEQRDEMMIWHSIATWVCCLDPNKVYHDPFAQDETKKAKVETKTADVKIYGDKVEITESKINKHMEKKTITESQLRKVVAESIMEVLNERTDAGTDGQWDYQWTDKERQNKAFKLGLLAGLEPDGHDGYHRNPHDIERRDRVARYDNNHKGTYSYNAGVAKAKRLIEFAYWDAIDHFGKENADLALQEVLKDKDIYN